MPCHVTVGKKCRVMLEQVSVITNTQHCMQPLTFICLHAITRTTCYCKVYTPECDHLNATTVSTLHNRYQVWFFR